MKAILIVDMPDTCEECPCCHIHENRNGDVISAECQMWYKGWLEDSFGKPSWCPLKSLPERKKHDLRNEDEYEVGSIDGWNYFIDEILGKENECNI